MKKRMFLSTILMTLVLLVAVTTATFAWYQASLNTSKASIELGTSQNASAGASMEVAGLVYTVNSKTTSANLESKKFDEEGNEITGGASTTVYSTTWSVPTIDGATLNFLPVSNNPSDDAREAAYQQSSGADNVGVSKWKTYVEQTGAGTEVTDFNGYSGTPKYDYYVDNGTAGLAAISFTFTIKGNANPTAQQLAISFKITGTNAGIAGNWCYMIKSPDSATGLNYDKVYQGQGTQYLATAFTQATTDKAYTVVIWLNGCVHTNDQVPASGVKFEFELLPYNATMSTPTAEAPKSTNAVSGLTKD